MATQQRIERKKQALDRKNDLSKATEIFKSSLDASIRSVVRVYNVSKATLRRRLAPKTLYKKLYNH